MFDKATQDDGRIAARTTSSAELRPGRFHLSLCLASRHNPSVRVRGLQQPIEEADVKDDDETEVGAAADDTEVVGDAATAKAATEDGLAWSLDDTDEYLLPGRWRSHLLTAGLTVLVIIAAVGVAAFGLHLLEHRDQVPRNTPAPIPSAAPAPLPSAAPDTTILAPPNVQIPSAQMPTPPSRLPTPSASAESSFSGRYTVTETWSNGTVVKEVWIVVPCGTDCVNITPEAGGSTVRAQLHSTDDGQPVWTFGHSVADPGCPGSHGGAAFIINAQTLSGTVTKGFDAACGQAAETDVDRIVLTKLN
ncbi:MAG: hypothetical protein EKK34_32120 [Mycobacterium sp.]|nr:MAG: hypothetical protein EKK34_32120 [Mycobacterium sp.]